MWVISLVVSLVALGFAIYVALQSRKYAQECQRYQQETLALKDKWKKEDAELEEKYKRESVKYDERVKAHKIKMGYEEEDTKLTQAERRSRG